MEDLRHPLAQLGHRVQQFHHLVAGLPFQAQIVRGDGVEHHLPSRRGLRDVPVAGRPGSAHVAVLERQPDAPVLGALGEGAEHFLELTHGLVDRLPAHAAREARDEVGPEQVGVIDQVLPALDRLLVGLRVAQGVAEYGDGADHYAGMAQHFLDLGGEPLDIHVLERLPEGDREALESMRQDLPDIGRAGCAAHQSSDPNAFLFQGVTHVALRSSGPTRCCVMDIARLPTARLSAAK